MWRRVHTSWRDKTIESVFQRNVLIPSVLCKLERFPSRKSLSIRTPQKQSQIHEQGQGQGEGQLETGQGEGQEGKKTWKEEGGRAGK